MSTAMLEEIKKSVPPKGKAYLWWLGQMGLVIKAGKTTALIDGFLTERPDRLIPPAFYAGAADVFDVVAGTHNHDDHVDLAAWKLIHEINAGTVFIAPKAWENEIFAETGIHIKGINEGTSVSVGDLRFDAIAAAHEFLEQDASGNYKALSYVINGRVFHAGDTLVYDGQKDKLRGYGKLSAMLLPINGRDAERYARGCIGNMTFQEAVDMAGELKPVLAIPGHYDMFKGNTADPRDFMDYLNVKYPDVCGFTPERYKKFEVDF